MRSSTEFKRSDRVLLVDVDEADVLDLASFLELSGFSVRRAFDSAEAMRYFTNFAPGVVFVDVNLPAKSWITLVQEIRQQEIEKDSDYRSYILLTMGRYSADNEQKALKAGVSGVVAKPIEKVALLENLAAHRTDI